MSLLVDEKSYSNYFQVNTYIISDLVEVTPAIIHGRNAMYPLEVTFKNSGILPQTIRLQIDNDYYDGFKMNNSDSSYDLII
jgi:hypothetical protein